MSKQNRRDFLKNIGTSFVAANIVVCIVGEASNIKDGSLVAGAKTWNYWSCSDPTQSFGGCPSMGGLCVAPGGACTTPPDDICYFNSCSPPYFCEGLSCY